MANSPGPLAAFVFEEDVANGERVELRDSDLPFGFPRAQTAFEQGGTLEHRKIYLPGRRTPIYQVAQARHRDLVIHGCFRDHLWATDRGTSVPTHARDMRDAIEAIRLRANMLRISWGSERWVGLLIEALFALEGPHDIGYTLTFAISQTATEPADPQPGASTPAPTPDLSQSIATVLAKHAAQLAALQVRASVLQTLAVLENAVSIAQAAAQDLVTAVSVLDGATGAAQSSAAYRVEGVGRNLLSQMQNVASVAATLDNATMAPDGSTDVIAAWNAEQYELLQDMQASQDDLRAIRAYARSKLRKTVRLYTVQSGDTLESIARTQLGDASRGGDLGVRADQLTLGRVVRIPEAS